MGIYRVRTVINGVQGLPGVSTVYFRVEDPPNATDALACAARVRSAWDVVKTLFRSGTTIQVSGQVDVLAHENGELVGSLSVTPPAVVNGTAVSTAGPAEVAAGLILGTGGIVAGRRVRGRLFISPLVTAALDGLTPPAGTVTAVNAFGVALISASPPIATAPPVVWSRPAPSRIGSIHPITSATIAPGWFVLKSRRD